MRPEYLRPQWEEREWRERLRGHYEIDWQDINERAKILSRIKNKAFIPDSLFAADSKRDAPSLVAIRRSAISINLRIC